MPEADVLILGAGAAGLACRMGLRGGPRHATVLEQSAQPGGLLRVHPRGAFTFDTVLHVLFFRDAAVQRRVQGWLPQGLRSFAKKNLVWQQGRALPYPYQFNTWALPEEVRRDCLEHLPPETALCPPEASFRDWLLAQFGQGFYRRFFGPYNRKLYGEDPARLEAAPMTWTIPADKRGAVLRGAQGPTPDSGLPNSHYPRGPRGIGEVVDALQERGQGPVHLQSAVTRVDLRRRLVWTRGGARWRYRDLVSTLPLPALLRLVEGLPPEIQRDLEKLRAAGVTVVRVGAQGRTRSLDADWTYFPDPEIPFYRMTRQERIAPQMSPPGSTALLLECPGATPPPRQRILEALLHLQVLPSDRVEHYSTLHLPFAYVLFLPGHRAALARARDWLSRHGAHLAGRYAQWRYANIEQTLQSGWSCADALQDPSLQGPGAHKEQDANTSP